MRVDLYFDGGGSHQGSPAGWGWVCTLDGEEYMNGRGGLAPGTTNNVAEYEALIRAAMFAIAHDWGFSPVGNEDVIFNFYGDSDLVVSQIAGVYAVRSPNLRGQYERAMHMLEPLDFRLTWIPRKMNARADMLATEGRQDYRYVMEHA